MLNFSAPDGADKSRRRHTRGHLLLTFLPCSYSYADANAHTCHLVQIALPLQYSISKLCERIYGGRNIHTHTHTHKAALYEYPPEDAVRFEEARRIKRELADRRLHKENASGLEIRCAPLVPRLCNRVSV